MFEQEKEKELEMVREGEMWNVTPCRPANVHRQHGVAPLRISNPR
jgi:hypothetical protein